MTEIDAVVTWVDGDSPEHRRKRERYMTRAGTPLHENGINPHRWASNDELGYCLRSISNNAKWIRHVWIVTDAQSPELSGLPADFQKKIKHVLSLDSPNQLPPFSGDSMRLKPLQ